VNNLPIKLSVTLCVLLCCLVSNAFAKFDPDLKWHTIETEHFLYHYHDGLEEQAHKLIARADVIHQEVSAYFNWTPQQKTHVIFNDHLDITNASATVLPNNTIELFMSPPSDITSLEDFDDWLELVFKHEYVHIIHLDKAHDFPYHARKFVGRLFFFFPNIFSPRWITEGIATFLETDHQNGYGRGQSSYFRGLMRNELINGLKPLNVINQNIMDWPGGTAAYLYGVYFFNFLREEYGDNIIQDYVDRYSHFPLPFFINTIATHATGKTMHTLWIEFEFYLHREFSHEISSTQFNEPKNTAITNAGYFSGFSKTRKNGNILFIKGDLENIKTLEEYNSQTHTYRVITQLIGQDSNFGQAFDHHETEGVLIPIIDYIKNSRLVFDLYRIDVNTGEKQRLTEGKRYIRAIWSPDGKNIAAIQNHLGKHRMDLLDNQGKLIKTLWAAEKNTLFSSFDWSPDGKQIIASIRNPNETLNLALFDLAKGNWSNITQNSRFEAHPSFNHNGTKLYYTADYDGIYNIYQLDLKTRDLYKLTNTPTIALYPNIDEKNNKLYFAELGGRGFDTTLQKADLFYRYSDTILSEASFTNIEDQNIENQNIEGPSNQNVEKVQLASKPYSGLSHLAPPVWIPRWSVDKFQKTAGILTRSNDPLKKHSYQALLEVDFKNTELIWDVNYIYSHFTPDFVFASSSENIYPHPTNYLNLKHYAIASIYPFTKVGSQWTAHFAYDRQTLEERILANRENTVASLTYDLFSVGLTRNSAQQPGFAVNKHSGSLISISYENNDILNSEFDLRSKVIADAIYYSPLILRSVFEASATFIAAGSQAGKLFLGGRQRDNVASSITGNRVYSLKGYAPGQFTGPNLQKIETILHVPLAKPQRGIMTPPLGITRIDAHPFAQAGRTGYFSTINNASWSTSVGIELTANINFGYDIWPFVYSMGVAKGLNTFGQAHAWAELSAQF